MKKVRKLLVYAAQDHISLVPDVNAMLAGIQRFIGWTFDSSVGENGAFVRKEEPTEVDYHVDYVKALKDGDLLPANNETKKLCGLK